MDIFLFEIHNGDEKEYLRFLCAVPITLFMLNKELILHVNSVSELETVFKGMIVEAYKTNRFINLLKNNVDKFYTYSNFLERIMGSKNTEWNKKLNKLREKIINHFKPVKKDNENYLKNIYNNYEKIYENPETFNVNYSDSLIGNLENIRNLYGCGTPKDYDENKNVGIVFRISKIKPLNSKYQFNKQLNVKIYYSEKRGNFDDNDDNDKKFDDKDFEYDPNFKEISDGSGLEFVQLFNYKIPKYLIIKLFDTSNIKICTFRCNIKTLDLMTFKKETIESYDKENSDKFLCEICVFKFSIYNGLLTNDEISLFNSIFTAPEYIHNINIENELNSYEISDSKNFKNQLKNNIEQENEFKNDINKENMFKDSDIFKDFFKKNNFIELKPDNYNKIEEEKIIKIKSKDKFNVKIANKVEEILSNFLDSSKNNVMEWLNDKNVSFEEILYSLVIIDKNSYTISEKLYLLFSIAQMKNKILFNSDFVSIDKIKEMIYALYKRFMIYFTKNEIDRMIDYQLKKERLFNIKYVFIYKENEDEKKENEERKENEENEIYREGDEEKKINKILFDRQCYPPNFKNENINNNDYNNNEDIIYDNIDTKFNIYLNYFANHYNIKFLSKENIILILKTILENSDNLKYYQKNSFNRIKIVIARDNIQYNRIFSLSFNPIEIKELYLYKHKPQNLMRDNLDKFLCEEVEFLELINSYTSLDEINFDKFKELFFNLPFLSDLLRISSCFTSNIRNEIQINNELNSLKVTVCFRKFNGDEIKYGVYYFGNEDIEDNEDNGNYIVKKIDKLKVKGSTTIDEIHRYIYGNIREMKSKCQISREETLKALINPFLFDVYVITNLGKRNYDDNNEISLDDKIMFYESLYSNMHLKNTQNAELKIVIKDEEIEFSKYEIIVKKDGYCKIYLGNPNINEYEWRKCKFKNNEPELISVDHKTRFQVNNDEKIENIEILKEKKIESPT
jgi:hypothetical protein